METEAAQTPFITPDSLDLSPIKPHRVLRSGWAQTIGSALIPTGAPRLQLKRHQIQLDDGASTVVSEVLEIPEGAVRLRPTLKKTARTCLLVHGLAGSEASPYITRLAGFLLKNGYRPFLMNLRGCGPAKGLSKSIYHSGRSDDTRRAITFISSLYPSAPLTQIGFSLGGNITLKMAGEDGAIPSGNLDSCVAVSAPLDLNSCAQKLSRRENFLFDQFFVQLLKLDIWKRHRHFPELGPIQLPFRLTLKKFDDIYTGPQAGFKNGLDYYNQCSSLQFIPRIRIPTLLISAADDPIIDTSFYRSLKPQPSLSVLFTEHGGHVGFLPPTFGFRFSEAWHDQAILKWLKKLS
jgi:uncharacterized protein